MPRYYYCSKCQVLVHPREVKLDDNQVPVHNSKNDGPHTVVLEP